ncbi:MAG: C45 family peptidase [Pseudomonadota bacterium]|nr:C45 family peptidase [Pseudomonadota bacterium]
MTLQVLDLPEEPRQRGEAHGEALREEANTLYQAHLAQLASQPAFAARGITGDAGYQAYAARFRPHAEAYAPHLWAELEGIAAGARMTVNQVLAQNLYLESYDISHPAAPAVLGGCTAWAHRRGAQGPVAEQSAMVGQTYDMSSIYEPAAFVLKTRSNGVELLALSFAGALGANGLSGAGFAVVINKLYGSDSRLGVPYTFIIRAMLEQPRPGDALACLLGCERAGSMNYIIGDGGGLLFNFETSATGWENLQGAEPYAVHANHFTGAQGKQFEARDFSGFGAHSLMRYARARQLLAALPERPAEADYRAILCDRHNEPWGIYTKEPPGGSIKELRTVASVIFDPASGEAWMSRGNAGGMAGGGAMTHLTLERREEAA